MFKRRAFLTLPIVLSMMLIMSLMPIGVVSADDGNPPPPTATPVTIRQGGPVVHVESAISNGGAAPAGVEVTRSGWTDAWWDWYYPLTYIHRGSHNSQSDLVEDQIWADGNLKRTGGATIASCSNHTSGQYANCMTSKTYYIMYAVTATSWHYFHKSGWTDQNFTTSKSITP